MRMAAKHLRSVAPALGICVMLILSPGCFTPRLGEDTELDDNDLLRMSQKMAESIVTRKEVVSQSKKPVIVLYRIVNETNYILDDVIYLVKIRTLLTKHAQDKVAFVLSREAWDWLEREELAQEEELRRELRVKPSFALKGTFYADTREIAERRSDYVLCTFQLVHLVSGAILWEDYYEVKKVAGEN